MDKLGRNIFHVLVQENLKEFMSLGLKSLKEKSGYTKEKIIENITLKDYDGDTPLDYIYINDAKDSLQVIVIKSVYT